ncbi:unnamed protein product, partial [Effrenium voratum]
QRRAAKKRAEKRKTEKPQPELLPIVDLTYVNRNTISGYTSLVEVMTDYNDLVMEEELAEQERLKAEAEKQNALQANEGEIARMSRLTVLAASALRDTKDEDLSMSKKPSIKESRALTEDQKRKRDDEAIKAAELGRERDPEEVAELLKPPDYGLIIERLNMGEAGFSQRELDRIQ